MLFGVVGWVRAGLLILFVGDEIDREPAYKFWVIQYFITIL